MSRYLVIALALVGCAPAVPVIDGAEVYAAEPGNDDDNGNLNGNLQPNHVVTTPAETCVSNAAFLILAIDTNAEEHNDMLPVFEMVFSSGSSYPTHNGAVEVPIDEELKLMSEDVSNVDLATFGEIYVYDANGSVIAMLEPTLAAPWVVWNCPT